MSNQIPRLRMFAGPNGSGKTTIKTVIRPELLGVYVNPDEIEKSLTQKGSLNLNTYKVITTSEEIKSFFKDSILLNQANLLSQSLQIQLNNNQLMFPKEHSNAYLGSVIADFIRQKLLAANQSFTFETVMSSPDKIQLLQKAQQQGYRTYLYYIATEDPLINISRIQYRVKMGNHDVPRDKIISRYERSLALLLDAIRYTNRTYLFDNSENKEVWVAEITDGKFLELKTSQMPLWFKRSVWDKLTQKN